MENEKLPLRWTNLPEKYIAEPIITMIFLPFRLDYLLLSDQNTSGPRRRRLPRFAQLNPPSAIAKKMLKKTKKLSRAPQYGDIKTFFPPPLSRADRFLCLFCRAEVTLWQPVAGGSVAPGGPRPTELCVRCRWPNMSGPQSKMTG